MKKFIRKSFFYKLPLFFFSFFLISCKEINQNSNNDDIKILFTSSIQGNLTGKIGFPQIAALKKDLLNQTQNVVLVDLGDAVIGNLADSSSAGIYVANLMNETGYDFAVLGNREFDFGLQNIRYLTKYTSATYLNCNISYTGKDEDFLDETFPYQIKTFGHTKIAFIGATSPRTLNASNPEMFLEKGKLVYDFDQSYDGGKLYRKIQYFVDKAKHQGATHVILLAHMDYDSSRKQNDEIYTPKAIAEHTKGIDVILADTEDNSILHKEAFNILGEKVLICETKSNLEQVGILNLDTQNKFNFFTIENYVNKDKTVEQVLNVFLEKQNENLKEIVATSDIELRIYDSKNVRTIRNRETPLGNLCADSYRAICNADIGLVNAGSIRAKLPKGNISIGNMNQILPFDDRICMVKATGQQILDALEFGCCKTREITEKRGVAVGEFGGFLQVSGLRYTIDTSVPSPLITSSEGKLIGFRGVRRVKNVEILRNGKYVPLDPKGFYKVAGQNFLLKNNGDGNTAFSKSTLILDEIATEKEAVIFYIIDYLEGKLFRPYFRPQGRIIVE